MRKNVTIMLVLVVSMLFCSATVLGLDFKRANKDGPMAAVMDFENKAGGYWSGYRLGRAAADVLVTELVKTTSLRCMEREKLSSIMKEKNLSASGLTTPDTYVKMGGMLGVKYMITGAVSSFGEKQIGGRIPQVSLKLKSYRAVIDVRIIDVETGEIVFADTTEGIKRSPKIRIKSVSGGEDYNHQAAEKVFRVACKAMAEKIQAALE